MTPQQASQAWLDAVNNHDLDAVLGLYDSAAILLPTFSPRIIRDDTARRAYFERLSKQSGLHVTLHERTFAAQDIGGHAIASGIYRFDMEIDNEPLSFEARFSFFLDPQASRPILHHHSSQIPRNLT